MSIPALIELSLTAGPMVLNYWYYSYKTIASTSVPVSQEVYIKKWSTEYILNKLILVPSYMQSVRNTCW